MKVKELIELLQTHDPEGRIISTGTDSGGYDSIITDRIVVSADSTRVYVGGIWEKGNMRKVFDLI